MVSRTFALVKPLALAAALSTVTATAGWAVDTSDPGRMARDIYALYHKDGKGQTLDGTVLAPDLLALVKADEKAANGEVGAIDADPICSCQDYDIKSVKVTVKPAGADKAEVTAAFHNLDSQESIRLSMFKTAEGWRITDIHSKDLPSLVKAYQDAAKDYAKDAAKP